MRKDKQIIKIDSSFLSNLFVGVMIFVWVSNVFAQTSHTLDEKIKVGPIEAITLGNTSQDTVYHCQFAQDTFTVTNTGDTDLDNIIFGSTDFNGIIDNTYFIPRECIYFTPSYINELPSGSTITVIVNIYVRCGLFAQDYKGKARVMDDDGYPHETIELLVTVLPKYDLDISDNEQDLMGNTLYLNELPGNSDSGLFLLINPNWDGMNVDPDSFGNADLTNLTYTMTNLVGPGPDITTANLSITPTSTTLASGDAVTLLYQVDIPPGQINGLYEGMVYVTSPGEDDTGDFFDVKVIVGSVEGITMTDPADFDADHGLVGTTSFTVTNIGNDWLDHIIFTSTNFVNGDYIINYYNVTFAPTEISTLGPGAVSGTININVFVPLGSHEGDYTATITAKDDDGYPIATQTVVLTVNPSYDLDISDNEQDLVANTLFLNELPGNSDSGLFLLINPNTDGMNVDPDAFGNADLTNLTYTMTNLVGPGPDITTAALSITPTPVTLVTGGSVALLYQVDIPADQIEGLYEGMVTVTSPGEDDTGDTFDVILIVGPVEGITMADPADFDADHGLVGTTSFTVTNTGNDTLDHIIFTSTNFVNGTYVIQEYNVTFAPTEISTLGPGAVSGTITINVYVWPGTHEGDYTATITAKDDDGYPIATQTVILTVNPAYDIDISDIEEDVVGNIMSLYACLGDTTEEKSFLTINPSNDVMNVDPDCFGNADYSVTYLSTDLIFVLDTISSVNVTITPSASYLLSGGLEVVDLYVTIPSDTILDDGKYFGYITAHADTEGFVVCSDSFKLELYVSSEGVVEFADTTQESIFFIAPSKPNPFINKTLIKYGLPTSCHVNILIYNLYGQEIYTLINEKQKKGIHTVCWDGRDNFGKKVPAGVYFLKVTAGEYTETKKLLKVR